MRNLNITIILYNYLKQVILTFCNFSQKIKFEYTGSSVSGFSEKNKLDVDEVRFQVFVKKINYVQMKSLRVF